MAAQLSATNGCSRLGLRRCSSRANSSLPAPDSPPISTVAGVGATRCRAWRAAVNAALAPIGINSPGSLGLLRIGTVAWLLAGAGVALT